MCYKSKRPFIDWLIDFLDDYGEETVFGVEIVVGIGTILYMIFKVIWTIRKGERGGKVLLIEHNDVV